MTLVVFAGCSEERMQVTPCDDCEVRVHPAGILDERSEDFHGKELARRNWDFALCASCHGDDFGGGKAGVACTDCHREGPTACTTCHADGPTSGAHGAHAAANTACAECHVVPDRWDAPGHIVDDIAPAEVTFGARANATLAQADRKGPASFANGSCSNVYCHGDALHAPGGLSTQPTWAAPAPTGTCVRCHASPPPSHARGDCATCHPPSAPHIDGALQIGTSTGCSGCHGDASSPAPNSGAHRIHLSAPSGLRDPIACSTCHVVPATIDAPGHLDPAPAEVTPDVCATCHGASPPAWTQTGVVACGTCHAIPPPTTIHATATSLATCTSCHPYGPSTHMNGVVDAQ